MYLVSVSRLSCRLYNSTRNYTYFSEIASSDYVERIVLQSGTTKDNKGTKQRKKIDTRRSIKSYFLGAWLVSDLQTL